MTIESDQNVLHLACLAIKASFTKRDDKSGCKSQDQFEAARRKSSVWQVARLDEKLKHLHRDIRHEAFIGSGFGSSRDLAFKRKIKIQFKNTQADPTTAMLFLHSHSGHQREQAVKEMRISDGDRAAQGALVLRCNDWVPEVQKAALARLRRLAPTLSVSALSELALFTLDKAQRWQRGGQAALEILQSCDTYQAALEMAFGTQITGPIAHLFRQALKTDDLDRSLVNLAKTAKSPFVRSLAAACVFSSEARWVTNYRQQWVDKSLGISRRVPVVQTRKIRLGADAYAQCVRAVAYDSCAMVRKQLADAFIRNGPGIYPLEVAILSKDPAQSVSNRMAFYQQKWGEVS